jgi:hypothetical protein
MGPRFLGGGFDTAEWLAKSTPKSNAGVIIGRRAEARLIRSV